MDSIPAFRIVTRYEDFAAGVRAIQMLERLTAQLRSEFQLLGSVWKFALLDNPHLREQAANEAAAADMIVISTSAGQLPVRVKDWIETWLPRKRGTGTTLVALLSKEPLGAGEPPPVWVYLRDVAKEANMDFFCNVGAWSQQDFASTDEALHPAQQAIRRCATESVFHLSPRGTGACLTDQRKERKLENNRYHEEIDATEPSDQP